MKKIIVITDPHLDSEFNEVAVLIRFIRSLNPDQDILLILGDLFSIWVESAKYHTQQERLILAELEIFRSKKGVVFFTAGNRDLFFKERHVYSNNNPLPFDAICKNMQKINFNKKLIITHHGDLINGNDWKHLLLRMIINSNFIRWIFNLLSVKVGKFLIYDLEKKMARTNKQFKTGFPNEQWLSFLKRIHTKYSPSYFLVGHFHLQKTKFHKCGDTTGIIVPSWKETKKYLVIDEQFKPETFSFNSNE